MDGIESKGRLGAGQLPRVKLAHNRDETPKQVKQPEPRRESESAALTVSFSGLSRSVQNNHQASQSLSRISKSTSEARAETRREVEQANRDSADSSAEDVEELANVLADAISGEPVAAMNAHKHTPKARDLVNDN